MKIDKIIKAEGLLSIIGAIGIIIWWFFMPVFLPIADSSGKFNKLPRSRAHEVLKGVCFANIIVSDPEGRGIKPHYE